MFSFHPSTVVLRANGTRRRSPADRNQIRTTRFLRSRNPARISRAQTQMMPRSPTRGRTPKKKGKKEMRGKIFETSEGPGACSHRCVQFFVSAQFVLRSTKGHVWPVGENDGADSGGLHGIFRGAVYTRLRVRPRRAGVDPKIRSSIPNTRLRGGR